MGRWSGDDAGHRPPSSTEEHMPQRLIATLADVGDGTYRYRVETWDLPHRKAPEWLASGQLTLEELCEHGSWRRALAAAILRDC